MALLLLMVSGTAALLAMDGGCYLWLRANDARRISPIPRLAGGRKLQARSA